MVGIFFVLRVIISYTYTYSQRLLYYLAFQSLDYGCIWWMLCQNPFVLIELDYLLLYYTHTHTHTRYNWSMTCCMFNWSLNLYAKIFQDYLAKQYLLEKIQNMSNGYKLLSNIYDLLFWFTYMNMYMFARDIGFCLFQRFFYLNS